MTDPTQHADSPEAQLALPLQDPAETYNPSTRLSKKRNFVVERPGNVNYAAPGGSYPGSRIVSFFNGMVLGLEDDDAAKFQTQHIEEYGCSVALRAGEPAPASAGDATTLVNLYFMHRANLLTVGIYPTPYSGLVVVYTNHLEGKRLEHFQKYQEVVAQTMEKWDAEQQARAEKEEAELKARIDEEKALVALGKKARDHNIIEKMRELADENDELKARLSKLEKQLKKEGK